MNREEYRPAVLAYVKATLGDLSVSPLEAGVNPNYIIGTPPQYVFKIGIYCDLAREQASLNILQNNGIPSLEVIRYAPNQKPFNKDILITRYVPHDGQSAHDPVALGKMLARIHTIIGEGYGPIGLNGEGTAQDWNSYLLSLPGKRAKPLRETLRDAYDTLLTLPHFPEKHSFLHLDFAGDNVLTKDGKIVAVFDPHGAFGDPLLDIAYTSIMNVDPTSMRSFMKGYAPSGLYPEELDRLRHYRTVAALDKYGIVLEKGQNSTSLSAWWKNRKQRMETILDARINGKDDLEFIESFL